MANPTAYPLKLLEAFERAVRAHERALAEGTKAEGRCTAYLKARDQLARKIGQLAKDLDTLRNK